MLLCLFVMVVVVQFIDVVVDVVGDVGGSVVCFVAVCCRYIDVDVTCCR